MSSPEARGLTDEYIAEHGDPMHQEWEPEPEHWAEQQADSDRSMAELAARRAVEDRERE